jgi:DNA-binding NarL/FixJ family response regulator
MDESLKFLIVDEHTLFRKGLALSLSSLGDNISFTEAKNCQEALNSLEQSRFDLIMLDNDLPDMSGFQCLKIIKDRNAQSPVIINSASYLLSDFKQYQEFGASGFIHKSEVEDNLLCAVRLILSGGSYFPTSLLSSDSESVEKEVSSIELLSLTPRQHQVLEYITLGYTNKLIAYKLGCTESTIRVHATAIFKVLKVKNRTEAAIMGRKLEGDS